MRGIRVTMCHRPKGWEEDPEEWVGKKVKLYTVCLFLRQERIVPMIYHEFVEVPHEWLRLYVQVADHLIPAPEANHIDDVTFNAGTEECHVTCGREGTSGYILGFESQVWAA